MSASVTSAFSSINRRWSLRAKDTPHVLARFLLGVGLDTDDNGDLPAIVPMALAHLDVAEFDFVFTARPNCHISLFGNNTVKAASDPRDFVNYLYLIIARHYGTKPELSFAIGPAACGVSK